ncbi:MAG: hypothetical protein D6768_09420, partial [Chloroflexi bacterium]
MKKYPKNGWQRLWWALNPRLVRNKSYPDKPGPRQSLAVHHVDTGSHHGPERELAALEHAFVLESDGIHITPFPRHADVLLVTGPLTAAMRGPLLRAFYLMPQPRKVVPVGPCAQRLALARRQGSPTYSAHDPYADFYDTPPGRALFVTTEELRGQMPAPARVAESESNDPAEDLFAEICAATRYFPELDTHALTPQAIRQVLRS